MNKHNYCRRIMEVYGVIVDFEGNIARTNVPGPIDENETLKGWTNRVLGDDVYDVSFSLQHTYAPQTRMGTIIDDSHDAAQQAKKILKNTVKNKTDRLKEELEQESLKHQKKIKKILAKQKTKKEIPFEVSAPKADDLDLEEVYGLAKDLTLHPITEQLIDSAFNRESLTPEELILNLVMSLNLRVDELDKLRDLNP
ncbi:hypothetical protein PL71_18045 [Pseudoalteromonas distincta]|uniref:Uncharacterized protein n=1 Tax=Pseudoalteromonas distincta TaxID=77608 RepID=A0ABT9GL40_9GAMM|nr:MULTISPECIES: hypothetical protein [Pseudoalteromonas distincta group]KHM44987.1 hypothetical protein PL71_18045 [Pseudoalteromonas elyakovii]KID38665.1 hypothetical protein QT16_09505 [Pseudoalteromonas distincta]MDP4486284.1 hypothetical protein [Pseudoalteromonas elyakovii]